MIYILWISNIFFYILTLKIFSIIFKNKYYFPFRKSDLYNFIFNTFFFILLNIYLFNFNFEIILVTLFINLNLFYIFFHVLNMINTSSRTKILLDIFNSSKINIDKYQKKYNEKIIVNNRIKRLKSSNQIILKNNLIIIKKGFSYFDLVANIFSLIRKI